MNDCLRLLQWSSQWRWWQLFSAATATGCFDVVDYRQLFSATGHHHQGFSCCCCYCFIVGDYWQRRQWDLGTVFRGRQADCSCSLTKVGLLYDNDELQRQRVARLSDDQKNSLLRHHWMPPDSYKWPSFQKSTNRVYLQPNHQSAKYGCFKLSNILSGAVCVPCALFATEHASNERGKLTTWAH